MAAEDTAMEKRLLLVQADDEGAQPRAALEASGWEVRQVSSVALARDLARRNTWLVGLVSLTPELVRVATDLERLVNGSAMEWVALLPQARLQDAAWAKLVVANFYDYHACPADLDRLQLILGHAQRRAELRHKLSLRQDWLGRYLMIGKSPPMLELYAKLDRVTRVDAPVLVTGESGTGKELVARAIHQNSRRARGPFVPVNCGALPETLVQSELFGHEKGAFTGAHQRKLGSFEAASGGTIFLDEIGDLPLDLQANLLRFLQEKTIVRIGSTQRVIIDARVIAATHVDLGKAVDDGRFREDLFYRLNVLHLRVPPLRQRGHDVELIIDALFREYAEQKNPVVQGFSQEALRAMREYTWPGNVRELMNRVQHAMIMSENRLITPADLALPASAMSSNVITLSHARATAERDAIRATLRNNANNISKAARELGISRVTLYRLMGKFNIDPSRER
jgi:DNA-binding NtrC family response regulator